MSNPMPKAPQKRVNQRGDATRDRILDAAEKLFAECGYDGTSMRDISAEADAELGSIGYHFRSKDDIYNKVIERRGESSSEKIEQRLVAVLSENATPTFELILNAFASSVFDTFRHGTPGEMHYGRLMMQRLPVEENGRIHSGLGRHYLKVRQQFLEALKLVAPAIPDAKLDWSFSLYELSFGSSLFSSTQKSFALQQSSPESLQDLQDSHVAFFAAGFHQLAAAFEPK